VIHAPFDSRALPENMASPKTYAIANAKSAEYCPSFHHPSSFSRASLVAGFLELANARPLFAISFSPWQNIVVTHDMRSSSR
jgi:hypothetical protein